MSQGAVTTTALVDFLLARLAEDEAVARAAAFGKHAAWQVEPYGRSQAVRSVEMGRGRVASAGRDESAHIARHDPARVLAECAFKREIVRLWEETEEGTYGDQGPSVAAEAAYALAAVYADHPDFDPGWRA